MIINEIFESIQGEGKYCGHPVLFIRLSGCTRNCDFCDTKYHKKGKKMSVNQVAKKIKESECNTVVWTGGEPMLQVEDIYEVIYKTNFNYHHLETNGDILPQSPEYFQYISFSPKVKRVQDNVLAYCFQLESNKPDWDIKIVTDLKLNKDMIEDATILMPLTTDNEITDRNTKQKVWQYCVKNNIKYVSRIHVDVWGKARRGI